MEVLEGGGVGCASGHRYGWRLEQWGERGERVRWGIGDGGEGAAISCIVFRATYTFFFGSLSNIQRVWEI